MKLLPCPFCGENEWEVIADQGEVSVRCGYCGSRGPWADTEKRAKVIWNARIAALKKEG
jgi:Lar family restriction alleviation protein